MYGDQAAAARGPFKHGTSAGDKELAGRESGVKQGKARTDDDEKRKKIEYCSGATQGMARTGDDVKKKESMEKEKIAGLPGRHQVSLT